MDILQLFSWSGLVNGIFSLGFGIFIGFRGLRDRTSRLFLSFTFAIAFWAFSFSRWVILADFESALFWGRMLNLGSLWIPILFFNWLDSVFEFSKKQKHIKYVLILGYALTITLSFFALSSLFVSTVKPELFFNFYPKPGILYHTYAFGLHFGLFILYSSFLLFRRYKKAAANEKKQILYLLLSIVFGAVGGATNFLLIYNIPIPPYGNFFVPLWVLFLGYVTVRYHAFGFKVITTEFLVFLIWSFLLSRIFLSTDFIGRLIDASLFLFVLVIGILLIGSVRREVRQRETLEKLSSELKDLNDHLEQKVAEQTQEIKQAYEVERKARVELEELDKAKDQFILTTQHHLRTPLTIIKGYINSLLEQPRETTLAESKAALNKTSAATDRLASLVNEFLDISQMEVGKSIINSEPTNIKNLLDGVVKELEPEIQRKNLKIVFNVENDTMLNIDPHKIREALTNIIDNAVKYNNERGEITVKGEKTRHPIERDKEIYRLTIEDTGIGLTQEELSHLFIQCFERGKEAEKLYTTGRGIGLAITKNIITAHNGRIYAESEGRNKGSKFIIELPV